MILRSPDIVAAWDSASLCAIHPTREISEAAYWESGSQQALEIASVVPSKATILDLGCGDGRVSIPLRRCGYEVIGVDSSPNMIAALGHNDQEIRGIVSDGTDLHKQITELVDVVICLAVLIHHSYDDGEMLISQMAKVVKPGGILILDWPTSNTPVERHTWIGVTTWPLLVQRALADSLGMKQIDLGLVWPTYEV